MAITVEATYENGVPKPKQPLTLPEGAEVRVTVCPADQRDDHLKDVIGICKGGPPDGAEKHDKYIYGDLRQ